MSIPDIELIITRGADGQAAASLREVARPQPALFCCLPVRWVVRQRADHGTQGAGMANLCRRAV